jgi:ATP-dependent DNA helicase PIF1
MWKTVARFIEKPIWKEFQSIRGPYGYYRAKLENKEGEFECSFGKKLLENYSAEKKICFLRCREGSRGRFRCQEIRFLNDNEEITAWEEVIKKIETKERNKVEGGFAEKLKLVEKENEDKLDEDFLLSNQKKSDFFEKENEKFTSLLNEEQKKVFYLAVKDRASLFFTGAAGTGKSFLLKKIIAALKLHYGKEKVAVTALTGIAAININGTTLHSFSGIGLGNDLLPDLIKKIQNSKRHQKRWQKIDTLIIDEISMLESGLFDKLEIIARTVRNDNRPFGGLQLIFCGDFFQLPPVTRGKSLPRFCFEAQSWKNCLNHSILLTKIHRQNESELIKLLGAVRLGEISSDGLKVLKELEAEPKYPNDGITAVQLAATNEEVNKINGTELEKLPYQLRLYQAIDWETSPNRLSEILRNCLAPQQLQLKLKSQVMLIKNLSFRLVNGSQGVVIGFQEQECKIKHYDWETKKSRSSMQKLVLPVVRFTNGIRKVIEPVEWNAKIPYTNIVQASRQQIPLILSWAITIHKSQGQTIERLKIDCRNIFSEGQLYVALSRATSVKYLQVIGFKKDQILCHSKVNNFYQSLLEVSRNE